MVWFLELLESSAEHFPHHTWAIWNRSFSHRWQKDLAGFISLGASLAVALRLAGFAHVLKRVACFILMVNGNKISRFVWLLYITTAEIADTDGNAPISNVETLSPLQFAHLICIWIHFRNLFGCTRLDFIRQIWNQFSKSTNCMPMLQFCVSKSTICASKFTHSFEFCASRITICASWTQWRALDTTLQSSVCWSMYSIFMK